MSRSHLPVQDPLQIILLVMFSTLLFEHFQQLPWCSGPWLRIYLVSSVFFLLPKNTSLIKHGLCTPGSHLPVQDPLQLILLVMFSTLLFEHFQQLPWCSGPWLRIYLVSSVFFFYQKIDHLLNMVYVHLEVIFQYKTRYK